MPIESVSSMQIEFNTSRLAKRDTTQPVAPQAAAAAPADSASFTSASALNSQLSDVSPVRTDKVENARQLIGDTQYPPEQLLSRIAALLAIKI